MSESDDIFRIGNPFPSTPVVQLRVPVRRRRPGRPRVSVDTRAVRQLRAQVAEYLDRDEVMSSRGRVLALIGDLGLGKSHLAREVVTEVHGRGGVPLSVIDQPALDLGKLYRDRLTTPQDDHNARAAFEAVVAGYHAQVIAEIMEQDTSSWLDEGTKQEFVSQLRHNELDSQKVAAHFEIDQELIYRHLRTQLREVTGHRKFAVALALLLDRRFRRDVWLWLVGNEPSPILVERGITAPIDDVDGVFDALAVFGFLHGQAGRPYALVIDALEDVLDWAPNERNTFLNGFEMLVNTYANRGGLLVLCIQPEPWSRLPVGLHERMLQVWPARLVRRETEELVGGYVRRQLEGRRQEADTPFTGRGLDELAEISDGVPRQILKTCRQAWQIMEDRAPGAGAVIDESVVHEAVRRLHEQRDMSDVLRAVERVLAADQWPREVRPEEVELSGDADLDRVDYWVRVGTNAAIAILVVPSVLVQQEVSEIASVDRAARNAFAAGDCRTLVLVNGLVPPTMRDRVAQHTGTAPLMVEEVGFTRRLHHAVKSLAERINTVRAGSTTADVRERLEAISATQANMLELLNRTGIRPADQRTPAAWSSPPPTDLPDPVRDLFADARKALDLFARPPGLLSRLPGVDASGRAFADVGPQRIVFTDGQLQAAGLVLMVTRLLDAFQGSVADWLRAVTPAAGAPTQEQYDGLFVLCRSFEITVEVLPALEPTGPQAPALPAAGTPEGSGDTVVFGETTAAARRNEALETLAGLAGTVRKAVCAIVTAEGGAAAADG